MSLRIGVTGGRDFDSYVMVVHALGQMPADATLVHGAATGADALCADWWGDIQGRDVDPHPANWRRACDANCHHAPRKRSDGTPYCPAAGGVRNQEMVDSKLDLLIAFPGGTGTADMVARAKAANVEVIDLRSS